MKILQKVRSARASGQLLLRIEKKIHSVFPVYLVDNKNIQFELSIWKTYKKFEKKYHEIISKGVTLDRQVKSDFVWVCWLQGLDKAPDLVKACVSSIRRTFSSKNVVIISNDNLSEYIQLPDYIQEKWLSGRISAAHYSDIIRTELLCKYGGVWIDATVLSLSDHIPDYIYERELFAFKELDLSHMDIRPVVASSWFLSSRSNEPILLLTRTLLHEYWRTHNHLCNYFLFHIFFSLATKRYAEIWEDVPVLNNNSPQVLQFELNHPFEENRWKEICQDSNFQKLTHHLENVSEGSYYEYIINNFLHP